MPSFSNHPSLLNDFFANDPFFNSSAGPGSNAAAGSAGGLGGNIFQNMENEIQNMMAQMQNNLGSGGGGGPGGSHGGGGGSGSSLGSMLVQCGAPPNRLRVGGSVGQGNSIDNHVNGSQAAATTGAAHNSDNHDSVANSAAAAGTDPNAAMSSQDNQIHSTSTETNTPSQGQIHGVSGGFMIMQTTQNENGETVTTTTTQNLGSPNGSGSGSQANNRAQLLADFLNNAMLQRGRHNNQQLNNSLQNHGTNLGNNTQAGTAAAAAANHDHTINNSHNFLSHVPGQHPTSILAQTNQVISQSPFLTAVANSAVLSVPAMYLLHVMYGDQSCGNSDDQESTTSSIQSSVMSLFSNLTGLGSGINTNSDSEMSENDLEVLRRRLAAAQEAAEARKMADSTQRNNSNNDRENNGPGGPGLGGGGGSPAAQC